MATLGRDLDSDAALVFAVQQGDTGAFDELFRRHHAAVRRVCARRLGDLRDADEVAQAAFVRAFERMDQCGGERRFGAWVQTIAHRLCIDAMRARARTTPEAEPVEADEPALTATPEEALLRVERTQALRRALDSLPPRQRDVVIDRDFHDRRPREIAAALGVSVGAVDSLLVRARRRAAATYEAIAAEGGLASLPVTSTVGTATAGTVAAAAHGRWTRAMSALSETVNSVSTSFSAAASHLPGLQGVAQDVAAAVVAGVIALSPLGAVADRGGMPDVLPPGATLEGTRVPAPAVDMWSTWSPDPAIPTAEATREESADIDVAATDGSADTLLEPPPPPPPPETAPPAPPQAPSDPPTTGAPDGATSGAFGPGLGSLPLVPEPPRR